MNTIVVLTTLVALVAASYDEEWLNTCLEAHNKFRESQGKNPLIINQTICPFSEERAEYQNQVCELSHDGSGNDYGENLAGGYDTSCPETVKLWTDEQANYEDGRSPGFYMDTGHYTQVVWANTKSFCCAIVESNGCPDKYYTACNYYPPGNYDGEFEDNV